MNIEHDPSPNFGERKDGKTAQYLILHYTGSPSADEARRLLKGGRVGHDVSAHYLVDEAGVITRLVDEDKRAWHAGKSYWEGEEDMNSASIGIEIQNPGHEFGYVPFTDAQIKAVALLCKDIMTRHGIPPENVLAHSDIAPARKEDPGELFPWEELAKQGIGIWPQVTAADTGAGDLAPLLAQYGYDARVDAKTLTAAFQRHFQPEAFKNPEQVGTPDTETLKRAQALLRQKNTKKPTV